MHKRNITIIHVCVYMYIIFYILGEWYWIMLGPLSLLKPGRIPMAITFFQLERSKPSGRISLQRISWKTCRGLWSCHIQKLRYLRLLKMKSSLNYMRFLNMKSSFQTISVAWSFHYQLVWTGKQRKQPKQKNKWTSNLRSQHVSRSHRHRRRGTANRSNMSNQVREVMALLRQYLGDQGIMFWISFQIINL